MCQRKPGPRCSADMKKNVQRAEAAVATSYKIALMITDASLLEKYYEKLDVRLHRLHTASLEYSATPEGIKELEASLSKESQREEYRSFALYSDDKKVTIYLPAADAASLELAAATEHRSWQAKALKDLDALPADKAKEFAELQVSILTSMQTQAKNQTIRLNNYIKAEEENQQGGDFDFYSPVVKGYSSAVAENCLREEYLAVQIKDLQSYSSPAVNAVKSAEMKVTATPVQFLQPGARIANGTILSVVRGSKTPSGKREVTYKDNFGVRQTSVWGANTKINVISETDA